MQKHIWNEAVDGPLTDEAIRSRHQPPDHFRVGYNKYPAGTRFQGVMRGGTCYVLTGHCRFWFDEPIELRSGEYAELPGGDFAFEVLGDRAVERVMVWALPEKLRGASST